MTSPPPLADIALPTNFAGTDPDVATMEAIVISCELPFRTLTRKDFFPHLERVSRLSVRRHDEIETAMDKLRVALWAIQSINCCIVPWKGLSGANVVRANNFRHAFYKAYPQLSTAAHNMVPMATLFPASLDDAYLEKHVSAVSAALDQLEEVFTARKREQSSVTVRKRRMSKADREIVAASARSAPY